MISPMQSGRGIASKVKVVAWLHRTSLLVLALAANGCFFFDEINSPPTADFTLLGSPDALYPNEPFILSATSSRDSEDGDQLHYEWVVQSCPSPNPCDAPTEKLIDAPQVTVGFPLNDPGDERKGFSHQPLVVTLTVSDSRHAPASTWRAFPPVNREPSVSAQLDDSMDVTNLLNRDGSYAVARAYHYKVLWSDPDDDPVALTWHVAAPSGHGEAQPIVEDRFAVTPDVASNWQLEVTASDGFNARSVPLTFVAADDQPPCVQRVDPEVPAGALVIVPRVSDDPFQPASVRFRIDTVRDDFDTYPYPAAHDELSGVAHFAWSVGREGEAPQVVAGRTSNDYVLDPAVYAPGERVVVRGVAMDRKDKRVPESAAEAPDCYQQVDWLVEVR
jgi:hypothetical protein